MPLFPVMPQLSLTGKTMSSQAASERQLGSSSLSGLWLPIILAIGPFVVRRIILIGDEDYLHWMAVDYTARCVSVIGVILGFRSGLFPATHPPTEWVKSLQIFLLLFGAECAEQMFGWPILEKYFHLVQTTAWPPICNPTLRAADLSAGLLFAVFVEELVFRKFLFAVIERRFPQQAFPAVVISATIFALVHFTSGIADTMINAFVHGIFFGIAYWTTRRLFVPVASHYLIDLLIFSSR